MSGPHERTVQIVNRRGLHARASAKFVTLASAQPTEVTVRKDGPSVTGTKPRARASASSASLSPPSGPLSASTGSRPASRGSGPASRSASSRRQLPSSPRSPASQADSGCTGATCGTRVRPHCSAAAAARAALVWKP